MLSFSTPSCRMARVGWKLGLLVVAAALSVVVGPSEARLLLGECLKEIDWIELVCPARARVCSADDLDCVLLITCKPHVSCVPACTAAPECEQNCNSNSREARGPAATIHADVSQTVCFCPPPCRPCAVPPVWRQRWRVQNPGSRLPGRGVAGLQVLRKFCVRQDQCLLLVSTAAAQWVPQSRMTIEHDQAASSSPIRSLTTPVV